MKFNVPLNNFSSGEWSQKMRSRTDTEQYPRSCNELTNFIVQMQGGVFRRPGTKFMTTAPSVTIGMTTYTIDFTKDHRLIPFTSTAGVGYILIFGYDSGSTRRVVAYNTSTGAYTLATIATSVSTFAAYSTMDYQQVGDVLMMTNNGDCLFHVSLSSGGSFTVYPFLDFTSAYVRTPTVQWKSVAYGVVEALGSRGTLTVTGTFTVGGAVTMVASNITTFNADDALAISKYHCFIKVTSGGSTGVIGVNTVTDGANASGVVIEVLPGASPVAYGTATGTSFQFALWRGNTAWPKRVTAYQGRIIFGGTASLPDTLWGSRIGNVWDYNEVPLAQDPNFTGFTDDNSRPFQLSPNTANTSAITALTSAKTLVVCTQSAELVAYGTQGALGPNDFAIESSTSFGCANVRPARTNNYLTIVQKGAKKLRDFVFNDTEAQYKSNDLSFVADHLTAGTTIAELCSITIASSIMFARLATGELIAVTLDREYQINAWSRIRLGGEGIAGATYDGPQVTTMAAVHNYTTVMDEMYVVVKRTINSATVYSLEKFSPTYEDDEFTVGSPTSEAVFPHYCDAWEAQTGASSTTWTFANKPATVVSVIADGFYVGEKTLSAGGVLTLARAATSVHVGFKYTSTLKPALIEQGGQTGSASGRDKRVHEIYLRLFNTYGCRYGFEDDLFEVVFDRGDTPMDEPVPFFTGDFMLKNPLGYSKAYQLHIETDYPFPCNVLSIGMQGVTYD